ncbi:hypothetical protein CFAM422_002883 [Trichoderma lentiforme]|uniref:Uncharacterized protein n=1 Tax=Trichoderma lentiforme TaxID=1567552 RepID=A0A9P4XM45_9HYPO|nr:hypothetical protein CFAM422_002883 [Trichoderma lentiforme]
MPIWITDIPEKFNVCSYLNKAQGQLLALRGACLAYPCPLYCAVLLTFDALGGVSFEHGGGTDCGGPDYPAPEPCHSCAYHHYRGHF